ncbi:hypothetical protein C4587_03045 [Candidatus Parcubacteria bacterium]|nr:MAG: hypothetical protein C4587_03045 [Candidatus Parcubacteria bacterium]
MSDPMKRRIFELSLAVAGLLFGLALLHLPIDANGQAGNGSASPVSDVETRGEPFLAKVAGEPTKIGRFGGYDVFEVSVVRCIGEDCTPPLNAFTRLRRGEILKGGDEVVVWEFMKRTKDGIGGELGFVALKANTATARDLVMAIRNKRGSIAPAKKG